MKFVYLVLIVVIFSLVSCTSEKEELYNKAIEEIRKDLKSPSSAKFADFDKKKSVHILKKSGKNAPLREVCEDEIFYKLSKERQKEIEKEYYYDDALVHVEYEAQNAFGVFLQGNMTVMFRRYEDSYCGNKECEWEYFFKKEE